MLELPSETDRLETHQVDELQNLNYPGRRFLLMAL